MKGTLHGQAEEPAPAGVGIGRIALLAVLDSAYAAEIERRYGFKVCLGSVGTMAPNKIVAAIETAAKREGLVDQSFRQEHALYHSILEALHGVGRGQLIFGEIHRTVGLRFSVVVGPRFPREDDGTWLAVAVFGTIGAPVRGFEHEVVGLGIFHM